MCPTTINSDRTTRHRWSITGQVQGVGFRPFIYRLARRYDLCGWVRNDAHGVTIEAQGSADQLEQFSQAIEAEQPPLAVIDSVTRRDETSVETDRTFVIDQIEEANLRGRGGAGFPTAVKWQFTRAAESDRKIVVCNADEGEPGTFKDRVILTERPDRMLAGMTIAAYAIGSEEGIIYLRAEYQYLRRFLEHTIEQRRRDNLLGRNIAGKAGFNFDVRIQLGAGAYICGEETALLSSCEGKRGDPKTRPPFPAQRGYLGLPTLVNNVETYCKATKILQDGPACFMLYWSHESTGTKLLSISGDCDRPGTYEVPFGVTIRSLLHMAGANDAIAVQISGAAGRMIGPKDFDHMISYSDLPTGGSFMVFGPGRNILEIVHAFMEFFCAESCGYCTPCRVGNVLLKQQLENIMAGRAQPSDLDDMKKLCQTIHATSRCGLGETSPNPMLSSLENFPEVYEAMVRDRSDGRQPTFDVRAALGDAEAIAGRESVHFAQGAS